MLRAVAGLHARMPTSLDLLRTRERLRVGARFLTLRPRCEHCGIHSGFEPSAAFVATDSLRETVRSMAWTLTG